MTKALTIPTPECKTTTAKQITLLHSTNFKLANTCLQWPITQHTKGTSINNVLNNIANVELHKTRTTIKEKLNHHNLYYIEQFIDILNSTTIEWRQTAYTSQRIPKGKQPR